jgi:hypothetical protein
MLARRASGPANSAGSRRLWITTSCWSNSDASGLLGVDAFAGKDGHVSGARGPEPARASLSLHFGFVKIPRQPFHRPSTEGRPVVAVTKQRITQESIPNSVTKGRVRRNDDLTKQGGALVEI